MSRSSLVLLAIGACCLTQPGFAQRVDPSAAPTRGPEEDVKSTAVRERAGLVPGARVHIRSIRPLDDVFEIEVARRRLVTGSEGIEGVMVGGHKPVRPRVRRRRGRAA